MIKGENMKKIFTFLLIGIMSFSTIFMASCQPKVANDENTLEIELFKAGYGDEFLYKLAERFMEKNPGKTVHINASPEAKLIRTMLPAGPNGNTADLFFAGDSLFDIISIGSQKYAGVEYPTAIEDLTDLYNTVIPGENITVKDKMFVDYVNYHNVGTEENPKFYHFPWAAGVGGITYNNKMFENNNWAIPNTTNELLALSKTINDAALKLDEESVYPFIFASNDSYWDMAYLTWWAQYDGLEAYNKFWQAEYYDSTYEEYRLGYKMMESDGRKETLRLMSELLKPREGNEKRYTDPQSAVLSFLEVQVKYFMGGSAMMTNGDWMEGEVRANFEKELATGEIDIRYMALPVLSALGEKLGITDEQLSAAVAYVRGQTSVIPQGVSAEALAEIEKSSRINQTLGVNHNVIIPAYSSAKNLAKEFLLFMATDEAQEIYFSATKGAALPFKFDAKSSPTYIAITEFHKSKIEIMSNSSYVFVQTKHPVFYRGGVNVFANSRIKSMEMSFFGTNNDPDELYFANYNSVYNSWETILKSAGLN